MQIENSTVLITGANPGIVLAFAKALLTQGAKKVYAGIANLGSFLAEDAQDLLCIVDRALRALEVGAHEVLADEMTQLVKVGSSAEQAVYLAAR